MGGDVQISTSLTPSEGVKYNVKNASHTKHFYIFFDVLLTVHLSIFISLFNQLDAQNLFHNKFYFMPLHVSSTLHSLWYHHTCRFDDTRGCVMQF